MATTGSRTLKLAILAEVADFNKNLKAAGTSTESLGEQFANFGKKAALAFAAAGAAIGAFAAASIKNALADEAAQRKLAETLKVSTGATQEQTRAVESWISKTSIAIGVSDDELRPSLARLARSTNDVKEAQDLLNLALDISAATGKPLEAVSNALGKAYDGNAASLGRLGLGLDANLLKSKDTDAIMNTLKTTFGSFAENEAETTAKKFERIKISIDEAKESIGAALLPLVEQMANYILVTLVPNMNLFIAALTGKDGFVDGVDESGKAAYQWGLKVKGFIGTVIDLKEELIALGVVIGTVFVIAKISSYVTATIAGITALIKVYNALKASALVAAAAAYFALNPLAGIGFVAVAAGVLAAANALAGSTDPNMDFGSLGAGGGLNPIQRGTYLNGGSSIPTVNFNKNGMLDFGGGDNVAIGKRVSGTGVGGSAMSNADALQLFKDLESLSGRSTGLYNDYFGGDITQGQLATRLAPIVAERDRLQIRVDQLLESQPSSFNPGSFRMGEAATMATYNITVNGAIDSEGTARTIVNTLNDSYYRGTSGAGALVGAFDK